jgi:predicted TIM-barrel fold metal-dependent hydrolase
MKFLAMVLMWTLKKFPGPKVKKTAAFLTIGLKKTQDMVFEELLSQYPDSDEARFIVLPLNFEFMGAGPMTIPYRQQLIDLFEVKKRYPKQCYPFVAIDPRMGSGASNRDFVKEFIEMGFSGIKLYPAMGFYPYDIRLKDVYEYAEKYEIPIMTHCSKGGINYSAQDGLESMETPTDLEGKLRTNPRLGKKNLGEYCDILNSPDQFELPLKLFPNLKVCIAHMGIDDGTNFKNFNNQATDDFKWYNKILDLMDRYEKVYMDMSYSLAYKPFYAWFDTEYKRFDDNIRDRILFGTDFFMTVQEEFGNDKVLFKKALDELGLERFQKLAHPNVVRYLNSRISTYS